MPGKASEKKPSDNLTWGGAAFARLVVTAGAFVLTILPPTLSQLHLDPASLYAAGRSAVAQFISTFFGLKGLSFASRNS